MSTMAVETQMMPGLNGHASDVDMGDAAKDGALRFTSGMILPPPEIKCEQFVQFIRSETKLYFCPSGQPSSTERHSLLLVLLTLLSLRTKFVRTNVLTPSSHSSTLPTHTMHTTETEWTGLHRASWVTRLRQRRKAVLKGRVKLNLSFEWMLGKSPQHPSSSWTSLTLAPSTCEDFFLNHFLNIPIYWSDRDIMKLTALFTAQRGRGFLASLSAREGRNYQFDFLRPNHSLFGYFNRLVEQYSKVINPNNDAMNQLQRRTKEGAQYETLELARRHAKWERNKREKDKKRLDDQEAEKSEYSYRSVAVL